jgi:adenylate cyclase class 2
MALEIEAKMRLADPAGLKARLEALAGHPFVSRLERNIFLDTPAAEFRKTDRGLRVRYEQDLTGKAAHKTVITYKGPRQAGAMKSREEIEVQVAEPDAATALLNGLGFAVKLTFEKRRMSWRVDDCRVELDEMPLLGFFVEIEGPGETSINAVRARLKLENEPLEGRSYVTLLAEHLEKHAIASRDIRF